MAYMASRKMKEAIILPYSYKVIPGLPGYADLVLLSIAGDIYLDTILISNDNKE